MGRHASCRSEAHPPVQGMDSKCGCTGFSREASLITLETTKYLVPCFSHNPYLREALMAVLGPTTAAFRPLAAPLLEISARPAGRLQQV